MILSSPGSRDTSANNSIFRESLEVYKQSNSMVQTDTSNSVFYLLKLCKIMTINSIILSTTTEREKQWKRGKVAGVL